MRKEPKREAPAWLNETVYEPKRQRTVELVKQAIDTLVEQRKKDDGATRISLNSIVAMSKQKDPTGKGIAHTAILENEEAYAYYKKYRTEVKPTKRQSTHRNVDARPVIKVDRDQVRARQRYMKLNREALVDQLLSVEQQYADLNVRYLGMNDKLLGWQLRAEAAEVQLNAQQEQRSREVYPPLPAQSSSPKPHQRKSTERTTGPLPKHLVSLLTFARQHNVAETTVQMHVDIGLLPAKHGEWTDTDGTAVILALDTKGKAAFHQIYRETPLFMPCSQCPHQNTEEPVQARKR